MNAADNSVVATAKNDENGLVKFKASSRQKANSVHKIRAGIKGDLPGVTYDEDDITATG